MLEPIYFLLFGIQGLILNEENIAITYKTYRSDCPDEMQAMVDQKLAPGRNQTPGTS